MECIEDADCHLCHLLVTFVDRTGVNEKAADSLLGVRGLEVADEESFLLVRWAPSTDAHGDVLEECRRDLHTNGVTRVGSRASGHATTLNRCTEDRLLDGSRHDDARRHRRRGGGDEVLHGLHPPFGNRLLSELAGLFERCGFQVCAEQDALCSPCRVRAPRRGWQTNYREIS